MTATTFTHLPLAAGSAVASYLGRAGSWALARYMRAPLSSTGLLAMVTLTALAASNALYFQTARHPAPFFSPAIAVADAPIPMDPPAQQQLAVTAPAPAVMPVQSTGSVAPAIQQAIPDAPVGNKQAFEVQKKLHELGLFNGKVDGFYGPMTATAIRTFEQRNGMTPTGALTPSVVDAILKADASGMVQRAAVIAPPPVVVQPAPVVQQAVQPVAVVQPPVVVQATAAQLPPLTPVDRTVDTVGSAAASSLDAIVAVVDGARGNSVASAVAPVPAMALTPPAQVMPAPVQVASLENTAPPAAVQAEIAPANNTQLVGQIQRGLASLGFYHGSIDGHPGDATARAIREFENFHSYRVTGQVNPDLVGLLRDSGASI